MPWARIVDTLLASAIVYAAEPMHALGKPLPAWSRGMLDIHQISTGRGNSALFILPDGTTMLVDAGAAAQHGHVVVRVEPGGGKYRVFALDDTTSEATVLSVHGPYPSR